MEKRFLKPICEQRARIIFETALEHFNYPTDIERLEEVREFCYKAMRGYNPEEVELMKSKIDELLADYKNKIRDYSMSYR